MHNANIQDRDGAKLLLDRITQWFPVMKKIWADSAYRGKLEQWVQHHVHCHLTIVTKMKEQHSFKPLQRRWVVERSFGWLNNSRRLSKDYEQNTTHSLTFVTIAFTRILLKKFTKLQTNI